MSQEIAELRHEIGEIVAGIELCKIQTALTLLCHAENLDLSIVDRLINRSRITEDDELEIVDNHGIPITFTEAVCGLRGESNDV